MNKRKKTYFTLKEMVSFGNYLLSDLRHKRIEDSIDYSPNQAVGKIALNQKKFKQVSEVDLANWKETES